MAEFLPCPSDLTLYVETKNLQKYDFDDMDPWSELLSSVAWAICSTHHTTLQATPGQLVFGRDTAL